MYGKYSFDTLSHAKSMLIAPPEGAIEHLYPPCTDEKNEELGQWFVF
jgi:aldehyde dehydrogenase (NAD+)